MTDHTQQFSTVTVPVALGGKSNPYVPDPAPTLLVELASVDRAKEEAAIAALIRDAEETAATIHADAEATAARLVADAETAAAALTDEARTDAQTITAAAEDEAQSIRTEADESAASTLAELDARQAKLEEHSTALDALQSELETREAQLTERLDAIDAEAAEAAAVLASAQTEADSVLAEARAAADEILEDARRQAEQEAGVVLAEARAAAENDPAVEERISEIESVHRIEVQVLHDRERELLERIAELESRAATLPATDVADHVDDSPSEAAPSDPAWQRNRRDARADELDSMAIDLDGDHADVTVGSDSRMNGRHSSDGRSTDRSSTPGPIVTHAPLTEQLSTSAFRAVPENDRRGRRRR